MVVMTDMGVSCKGHSKKIIALTMYRACIGVKVSMSGKNVLTQIIPEVAW